MKKIIFFASLLAILFSSTPANAQTELESPDVVPQTKIEETKDFYRAKVTAVTNQGISDAGSPFQTIKVEIISGDAKGQTQQLDYGKDFTIEERQKLQVGDEIVLNKIMIDGKAEYIVMEKYRLNGILILFMLFFVATIALAGRKGFRSIIGLGLSILVLVYYIMPQIINGANPAFVSLIGSLGIMLVTLYLAHGFNQKTTIAMIASLITLSLTILLSNYSIHALSLFGLGSEDAFFLQSDVKNINLQGLLLGGLIIGVLGVLDDITTAQAAAVHELKQANLNLGTAELYKRAINIGREHIASLVNTLALAYFGASLPLLLLITVNLHNNLWVVMNGEMIAEEIVRTLIGSLALILAVPITTIIAAWWYGRQNILEPAKEKIHTH